MDKVLDGDTIDVTIDLGFDLFKKERVRIAGVDTPEKRTRDLEEKELGIDAEIIDLRTIRPIDFDTIIDSVKKTNRCVTVEESFPVCSIGSYIGSQIMIRAFDYLDAPVLNCTGKDVPMPYAENLEKAALITPDEIVFSVKQVLYRD